MGLRNRRYFLRSMGTFPTCGLKGVPPSVLSELFGVGGNDGVYRWMRSCRVAQYSHKSGGPPPENLRDFGD